MKRTRKAEAKSQRHVAETAAAIHEAIVRLSPWTGHHAQCARVTQAAECDCGLNAELKKHQWST